MSQKFNSKQFKAKLKKTITVDSRVFRLDTLGNDTLVGGHWNGDITVWNAKTWNVVRTLKGHASGVYVMKMLPNGTLASGSIDTTIKIWNPQNGNLLRTLEGHKGLVITLEVLSNDGLLASGSTDKTIKIWNLKTGKLLNTIEMNHEVFQIILLRDGNLAIRCKQLNEIIILNPKTLKEVRRIKCNGGEIIAMVLLSDGMSLATAERENKEIKIWNARNGELLKTLEGHQFEAWTLYLLDDGNLASGSKDGEIKIWEITSNRLVHSFKAYDVGINDMITLNNNILVSCAFFSDEIKIWK